MKLLISDYEVTCINENTNNEFIVKLKGPQNSIYEAVCVFICLTLHKGSWFVRVMLPD